MDQSKVSVTSVLQSASGVSRHLQRRPLKCRQAMSRFYSNSTTTFSIR
ncbi:hypothetical protein [Lentzea roselyniae]